MLRFFRAARRFARTNDESAHRCIWNVTSKASFSASWFSTSVSDVLAEPPSTPGQPTHNTSRLNQENDIRDRVLHSALAHVPEYGWTTNALRQGCIDQGLSASSHAVFDDGPMQLVYYFMKKSHNETMKTLQDMPLKDLRQLAILREALKFRLTCILPYIDRWPSAMAMGSLPNNVLNTSSLLGSFVDDIWHLAGDASTDTAWYTRRAALLAVYTSSEIYLLTDRSLQHRNTWRFLEDRLQDLEYAATLPDQFARYSANAGKLALHSLGNLTAWLYSAPQSSAKDTLH